MTQLEMTKLILCYPKSPDTGWIPTSASEKKNLAADIPEKVLKDIFNPLRLSLLQEKFRALHGQLWHLLMSVIF